MASRADCDRALSRSYGYFDALVVSTEVGVMVDKTPETMAAVKNRDQFHGAEKSGGEPTGRGRWPPVSISCPPRGEIVQDFKEKCQEEAGDHAGRRGIGNPRGR